MKLATWNINSLSVRLPQVLDWLAANPVDALGLQELKLVDEKFPHDALKEAGYHAAVFGQKTYNGVAILSRTPVTDIVRNIPQHTDDQSRVIAPPTIDAGPVHLPISRWYEESGAGQPWSGVLRAGERVRVNVIGDIPEHITPGTVVDARIEVDSVAFAARAEAQAVIHLQR